MRTPSFQGPDAVSPPPGRWPAGAACLAQAGLLACGLLAGLDPRAALVNLLLAPWLEEYLLRAGLQDTLRRRRPALSASARVLLCAFVFAVAHFALRPDLRSAATAIPAIALGAAYERWRRLLPCAWLHGLFNLIWFLPPFHP